MYNFLRSVVLLSSLATSTLQESSRLSDMVKVGDYNGVKQQLERGADPTYEDPNCASRLSLLFYAIPAYHSQTKGDRLFELILSYMPSSRIDTEDKDGKTVLFYAAYFGYSRGVELLIRKGSSMTKTDRYGATPLHIACMQNHYGTVKVLVGHKSSVNAGHKSDIGSPLMKTSSPRIAQLLLQSGANPNSEDSEGRNAAHILASRDILSEDDDYDKMITLLAKSGIDINKVNGRGETPLILSSKYLCVKRSIKFLENGADASFVDKQGRDALFYTLNWKPNKKTSLDWRYKAVALILKRGGNCDLVDNTTGESNYQLGVSDGDSRIRNLFRK